MRKDTPPTYNRYLQLVPPDGSHDAAQDAQGWPAADGPAPLLRQITAESRRASRSAWRMTLVFAGVVALVYAGLRFGALQLRPDESHGFDARRFSMAASVYSRVTPEQNTALQAHDAVRADDAWRFVLHNRSHTNAYFGLFAVSPQGQFFWFYPRDGGGVDLQTLPLPAIPTITLPDGVTPDALAEGPLKVLAVFLPQPALLSQLEADYAQGGTQALRAHYKADVQQLEVNVVKP